MDLLADIAAERNITLLMILHQIPIAKRYADRFIALKNGEVFADDHISVIDEDFETALFGSEGPKEPPAGETSGHMEQEAGSL